MANRIFRVDIADGARDFTGSATEPGLAMLDRAHSNYQILRRWFGNLVAEPQFNGDSVSFYVQGEEEGRLEEVDCYTVTKEELEGSLAEDLNSLQARLKKAKPETPSEQLLYRIVKKTLGSLTNNLDQSDYEHYFFKYRQARGQWRLVWCWGYQRVDQEPASTHICTNQECQQLFVRRPKQRSKCPGCETLVKPRRRNPVSWVFSGRRGVVVSTLLLLLLLGFGYFLWANQPQLVATPLEWKGPQGSRIAYQVVDHRWYFWRTDVTGQITATPTDPRLVEFAPGQGLTARTKRPGVTAVALRYGGRVIDAKLEITPAPPPEGLKLEPDGRVALGVGATTRLRVLGTYTKLKLEPIDFTDRVGWESSAAGVASVSQGVVEGVKEGTAEVKAFYRPSEGAAFLTATTTVDVKPAEYVSLVVKLAPEKLRRGEAGQVQVIAKDKAGHEYSVEDSTLLQLRVKDDKIATLSQGLVTGRTTGETELEATLGAATGSLKFTVGPESLFAGFHVSPSVAQMSLYELLPLDIQSDSDEPITITSSDNQKVLPFSDREVAAIGEGKATLTVKQGAEERQVEITVGPAKFVELAIRPTNLRVRPTQTQGFRIVGLTETGDEVEIAPPVITFARQPKAEYATVDRARREVTGESVTPMPQKLEVRVGRDFAAVGWVEVTPGVGLAIEEDEWQVYPPISVRGGYVYGGNLGDRSLRIADGGLIVDRVGDGSLLAQMGIPANSYITDINGRSVVGLSPLELEGILRQGFGRNSRVTYVDADGVTQYYRPPGLPPVGDLPVTIFKVQASDVTPADFVAQIQVFLRDEAEYRVVDKAGQPLSEWLVRGPGADEVLTTTRIPRSGSDNYEVFIERRIGADVKQYQVSFDLKERAAP